MNMRGKTRCDQQAAASAATFTSPDTSAKSKLTLGSESATLMGSLYTNYEGEEGGLHLLSSPWLFSFATVYTELSDPLG
jgi:hypothetical protein